MELNFNWKYKDYELRACNKNLTFGNGINNTIDFIQWYNYENGGHCYSIAYWKLESDGYTIHFVADRLFDIDQEDILIIWEQLKLAQETLDDFYSQDQDQNDNCGNISCEYNDFGTCGNPNGIGECDNV